MLSPFVEYMSCSLNSGAITSIKFNPKGNQIGVATSIGHLFIFNKGFSDPSIEFPPSDGPINQISWDITSTFIFAVTEAGSLWRYDISTLSILKVFMIPSTSLLTCESSLSNSYVAIGSTDGDLSLFKSDDIKKSNEENNKKEFINENSIQTIKAHSDAITGISFRNDGLQFITCSYDSIVRVWGSDLICTQSFSFRHPILSVRYQSSGKMFYICDSENSFKLISLAGNVKKNNSIDTNNSYIIGCINIHNHADSLPNIAIGLSAGVIIIYTQKVTLAGEFQSVINVQKSPFYAFDFHPSEQIIATGGGPNEMNFKIWKLPDGSENSVENKHENENYFKEPEIFNNVNDDDADKSDDM